MPAVKLRMDCPHWVDREERDWALRVIEDVYRYMMGIKYVDKSALKNIIDSNASSLKYPPSNEAERVLASAIKIIKVAWKFRSGFLNVVEGDITFQIVLSIPGLEKFTVYATTWAMHRRRAHSYMLEKYMHVSIDVDKPTEVPIDNIYFDSLPLTPHLMAMACVKGIEIAINFKKYLSSQKDAELLDGILSAISEVEQPDKRLRLENLQMRLPANERGR